MTEIMSGYLEGGAVFVLIILFGYMFYRQQKRIDRLDASRDKREQSNAELLRESYDREKDLIIIVKSLSDEIPIMRGLIEKVLKKIDRGVNYEQERQTSDDERNN